jgi:threonine-phosphate decarboxylase
MKHEHGGTIYRIAREKGLRPYDLLDFSANINPLGFSRQVKKILQELQHEIINYPDQQAYELTGELARYHGISQENILAGNGSTEFIFLLPRVLQPKRVLLVVPTFAEYEASILQTKGRVFYFNTTEKEDFSIDTIKLLNNLQEGFDALYICNPGNPTGVLTGKEVMKDIISGAAELSTRVIVDETFIDFNESQSLKQEVNNFPNLYILRSMTKFFALPGLRAGYVFSCKENIERLRQMQEPWTMNAAAQYASSASLRDSAYIRQTRAYVLSARNVFINDLQNIPCIQIFRGSANYLLLKLTEDAPVNVHELYDKLLKKMIIIRKCHNFQGLNESFFRVAVKKKMENKRLVSELKKILT